MEEHEERVLEFFVKGDWKNALRCHQMSPSPKLLWPVPEVDDLTFIGRTCRELGVSRVTSVGSGRGFFEWLLTSATGLPVTCLELDELFWRKIGRTPFAELLFKRPADGSRGAVSPQFDSAAKSSATGALLFCYFNDSKEFLNYLNDFNGRCLIILGSDSPIRLTNPSPFPEYLPCEWKLVGKKDLVLSPGDVITIYFR